MDHDQTATVLVVAATEDNLRITARLLETAGVRCLTASRGWDCLATVKREVVDLILLDLHMPHMDGWSTLEALRQDSDTRDIAVVIFTCDDRLTTRQRAMQEGAVDFLPRPVRPEKLVACVHTQLSAIARTRAMEMMDRRLELVLAANAG